MSRICISGIQLKAELCDNEEGSRVGIEMTPEASHENLRASGQHIWGFNGISRLWIDEEAQNPFFPSYSGFTCEALFDASGWSFEPMWASGEAYGEPAPSCIETLSASSAKVIIEPGKRFMVKCETVFSIEEPGAIDVSIEMTPYRADYEGGYVGVLWANHIHDPSDKHAYFPVRDSKTGQVRWKGCFEAEDSEFQVYQPDGIVRDCPAPKEKEKAHPLLYGTSKDGFVCPAFFGRMGTHLFAIMLDPPDVVRLAFHPEGDGLMAPAWDFQTIIYAPVPRQTYRFRARLIFGPLALSRSLLEKYRAWSGSDVTALIPPVPRELTEKMRRHL